MRINSIQDLINFFSKGNKMNPTPTQDVYVVTSEHLGVLVDLSEQGTLWTNNVKGYEDVRTFTKEEGEQLIERIRPDLEAQDGQDPALRVVPATADVAVNRFGQKARCSKGALANRLLV